jgi:hypothetical protein
MNTKRHENDIKSMNYQENNMQEIQNIQKKIRFLQISLVQLSFASNKNRPQLYTDLMISLKKARKALVENKHIVRDI